MSDSPLNDPLLSAFLDGALDQEQGELVEKRIANNPGLQTLLQQWKEQGNALRSLPIHQLRGDLSQSVLNQINRRRLPGELANHPAVMLSADRFAESAQRPDHRHTWRTWLIAIPSLAGLILIGFFLLRPDPLRPYLQLARGVEKQENSTGTTGMGSSKIAADADDAFSEIKIDAELRMANESPIIDPDSMPGTPSSPTFDLPSSPKEPSGRVVENTPAAVIPAPNRDEHRADIAGSDLLELDEKAKPELFSKRTALLDPGPQAKAEAGGMAEDHGLDRGDESIQHFGDKFTGQTVSIPQVYFVEFTSKEQPLAVVSEIFSRNQIEIRLPDSTETPVPKASTNLLTNLASKSSNGLEAIYVVATRSQLRRAMAELSDSANISGFEVTSSILGKMLGPITTDNGEKAVSNERRMEDMIIDSRSSSIRPSFRNKLKEDGNRESAARNKSASGAPIRVRPMAQQLQPIERMQRQFREIAPKQPGALETEEPSDSLDRLFQSKLMVLNWNCSRSADRAPAAPSLRKEAEQQAAPKLDANQESAAPDGQDELVQFLLLVRTTRSAKQASDQDLPAARAQ